MLIPHIACRTKMGSTSARFSPKVGRERGAFFMPLEVIEARYPVSAKGH